MKTALIRHTVSNNKDSEFWSYAPTPAAALANLSAVERQSYKVTKTEEILYSYAPFVGNLIKALGDEWSAEPTSNEHPDCGWYLIHTSGMQLYFTGPSYNHKQQFKISMTDKAPLNTSRQYVQLYDEAGRVDYPSIKTTSTKSAAQVAADINRRLMPEARRVFSLLSEHCTKEKNRVDSKLQALTDLCAAFRIDMPLDYYSKEPRYTGSAGPVDWDISSADYITLTLRNADLKMVRKIAAALLA